MKFPKTPHHVYKDKWKGWGAFLQTGEVATYNLKFWNFEKSRRFVRKLNLKNLQEWQQYVKSDKKPKMLHSTPQRRYKNEGWKGYGDFLGTGRIGNTKRVFLTFDEAKKVRKKYKLKGTQGSWKEFVKSGKKPQNIPSAISHHYKDDWVSYPDFMGVDVDRKTNKVKNAFTYDEFKSILKIEKVYSRKSFLEKYKQLNIDYNNRIPSRPSAFYSKKNEWIDWDSLFVD